ncbi:MAG: pantetheine-phosphate adenylyltransferase [Bacteroidales bacterium]|jgi:pantetheine-phosphate adenylyltransferase|nr:pantetheine-phosphate adenylyltransferase [Bacteroidales bacterium]
MQKKKKIAILPGTFDPFTIGHLSLVHRGLLFLDEIVIAIGINEQKRSYFPIDKRVSMIAHFFRTDVRIRVESYDSVTVDFAAKCDAHFILRGIRTVNDFEYEKTIADMNKALSGIETIILFTEPEHTHISSTVVRELLRYGKDVSQFVPDGLELVT